MIVEQSKQIVEEISKAFIGKTEIIEKVLMTIYAGGHVLLEDAPGVGKTTLALAFSKVLGLSNKRIQFTTDTLPSDSLTEADWRRFQRAVSHITISQDTEVTLIFTDKKATGKDE